MSKSQNTKNERNVDVSKTLTEQWKKGELPEGFYYIKVKEVMANYPLLADCVEGLSYTYFLDYEDYVTEVLAPVPSYDELENMNEAVNQALAANIKLVEENKRLKHDVGNLGYKIKNQRHEIDNRLKEIEKLKELLKECKDLFVLEKGFMVKCIREKTLSDIIAKIDEVLK